ncbi:hypothetical protein E2C01_023863 [Portunus trituberculatus]|uniref:Uncharacterized protein n=1 Tax=Portunus trituberculatus TaxID=210409 RepID=A0A5B7EB51_PORTR|nr:hypothetical protein [Portunus trituberculatus]
MRRRAPARPSVSVVAAHQRCCEFVAYAPTSGRAPPRRHAGLPGLEKTLSQLPDAAAHTSTVIPVLVCASPGCRFKGTFPGAMVVVLWRWREEGGRKAAPVRLKSRNIIA